MLILISAAEECPDTAPSAMGERLLAAGVRVLRHPSLVMNPSVSSTLRSSELQTWRLLALDNSSFGLCVSVGAHQMMYLLVIWALLVY